MSNDDILGLKSMLDFTIFLEKSYVGYVRKDSLNRMFIMF